MSKKSHPTMTDYIVRMRSQCAGSAFLAVLFLACYLFITNSLEKALTGFRIAAVASLGVALFMVMIFIRDCVILLSQAISMRPSTCNCNSQKNSPSEAGEEG